MTKRVKFENDHPSLPKPRPTKIYAPAPRTFKVTIEFIDPNKILLNRRFGRQNRIPTRYFGNSKENFIRVETVALQRAISLRNKLIIRRTGLIKRQFQYNGQDLAYRVDKLTQRIKAVSMNAWYHQEKLEVLMSFT